MNLQVGWSERETTAKNEGIAHNVHPTGHQDITGDGRRLQRRI